MSVIKNKNCIRHEKKGHLEIQNKRENKKVSEDSGKDKVNFKDSIERSTTSMQNTAEVLHQKEKISISQKNCGETVVLSANIVTGPATLVSREPGELLRFIFRMTYGNWKNGECSGCGDRTSYSKPDTREDTEKGWRILSYRFELT